MANTKGEKELRTNWPIEEGLIAGTTTQTGNKTNMTPETSTKVLQRNRVLL